MANRFPLASSLFSAALSACTVPTSDRDGGASSVSTNAPLRLKVASWNLEHLAERDGEGCRPRSEADYADLRRHAVQLGADVIAFQEVESTHFRAMQIRLHERWPGVPLFGIFIARRVFPTIDFDDWPEL